MFNVTYDILNESNNIKLKVISVIECLVSKSISLDGAKFLEFHLYCLILTSNFFFSLLQDISHFDNFFFEFFISLGQSIALDFMLNDVVNPWSFVTLVISGSQNASRSFGPSSAYAIKMRID